MSLRYGLTGLLIMAPAVLGCGAARAQGVSQIPTSPVPQALAPPPAPASTVPDAVLALPEGTVTPVVPAQDRLSLDAAIADAERQNPTYRAAQQSAESALRFYKAQRLPLDPLVQVPSGFDTNIGTFEPVHPEDVNITFTFETSGRQGLRARASRALYRQALQDAETARQTVRQGVENAYVALQVANRVLEAQQDLYRLVARQTYLTDQQFKIGTARESDLIRLQIALTQAEQALIQARATVFGARATLNQQLGRSAEAPIDAAEPLLYQPLPLDGRGLDSARFKAAAYENRPEMKSEGYALENLHVGISQQRSQYRPDLVVSFRPDALVDRKFGSGSSNVIYTASVTFPLPLGSIRQQIRKAQSDVKAEEDRREAVRTQIALDVETALVNLRAAQRTTETYENGILARARSLVDRTQRGFEIGGSTILDVIDAQTTYRTSLVSYYQAIGAYQQALAQLKRALGTSTLAAVAAQPGAGRS